MTAVVREIVPLNAQQQELVKSALDVVDKVARLLAPRYESLVGFDDLLAMGREGLVQAARTFDAALGVPFSTFATYRVQGAMLDGIRKEAGRAREIGLVARIAAAEVLAVQREADVDIMTDSEAAQRERLQSMADGLTAAMFAGLVGAASKRNAMASDEAAVRRQQRERAIAALREATSSLSERDRRLLEMHYDEQRDLKEVAGELKVSYASVRRYHTAVIERLAARLKSRGVREPPPTG
jgi:RNA polymerase sigma factor FliA